MGKHMVLKKMEIDSSSRTHRQATYRECLPLNLIISSKKGLVERYFFTMR